MTLVISSKKIDKVEDALAINDEIMVIVTEIDDKGRVNLSTKEAYECKKEDKSSKKENKKEFKRDRKESKREHKELKESSKEENEKKSDEE